jgi:competence protein ComFC
MEILDLFFPKKCVVCKKIGSFLCDNCFSYLTFDTKSLCLVCQKPSFDGLTHPGCKGKFAIDGCFSSIPYTKTAQKLIYTFKYKPFVTGLKKIMGDLFYEGLIQNEHFMQQLNSKLVLVPVPLFESKLRKRGYNQSEILAKELAKKFNLKVQNLLIRTRNTKAQFGLNKEERKKNIRDAFALNSKFKILNSNIFLVDDLVTTGSTLLEMANVLKRNGAKKVIGLTLARD